MGGEEKFIMMGSSSDPPGSKTSSVSLFKDTIKEKANKEWVEVQMKSLEKDIEEAKKIAISARDAAKAIPECQQEEEIKEMRDSINSWRNVKFIGAIGLVVIISGAIAFAFALQDKTDDTEQTVEQVKESVKGIEIEVKEVTDTMEEHLKWVERKESQDKESRQDELQAISEAVRIAIEQADVNSNRRRTR